jgi:c-di-GMP-binding flagellar brake protein YcgR
VSDADRRQESRVPAQVAVGIKGAGAEALTVSSLNLSAGGVYVQVPHFIEPLTKVALVLDVPGPTPGDESVRVETEAIVVRTVPETEEADTDTWEVACAFLALKDEYRDAIHRYILTHRAVDRV